MLEERKPEEEKQEVSLSELLREILEGKKEQKKKIVDTI